MICKFVVTLKNKNQQFIDWFTIFLLLISSVMFLTILISSFTKNLTLLIISVAAILSIGQEVYVKMRSGRIISFRNILFITALGWLCMPFLQWVAIPLILLALIEKQAKYPLEIGFTDEQILVNSLFRKKYLWNDFESIILKDGFLTLNFKNDKLIQQEVLDDEDDDAEEDEFNEYCRQQLMTRG